MNNLQLHYFDKEDILHLTIGQGKEASTLELSPTVTVELNSDNEVIGVEILNARDFLRDSVLESIQAKTQQLLTAQRK